MDHIIAADHPVAIIIAEDLQAAIAEEDHPVALIAEEEDVLPEALLAVVAGAVVDAGKSKNKFIKSCFNLKVLKQLFLKG